MSGITADELQPATATPGAFQVVNFVSTPTSTSFALGAFGIDDAFYVRTLTVDPQSIPEPSSLLLLGAGAICLLRRRQRREIGLSSMETE